MLYFLDPAGSATTSRWSSVELVVNLIEQWIEENDFGGLRDTRQAISITLFEYDPAGSATAIWWSLAEPISKFDWPTDFDRAISGILGTVSDDDDQVQTAEILRDHFPIVFVVGPKFENDFWSWLII